MVEIKHHEQKGKLIAVEGLDGSGKSTQIYLLKRWLELEGYRVSFTEWNSSFLVKRATKKGQKTQAFDADDFFAYSCDRLCRSLRATNMAAFAGGLYRAFRSIFLYCVCPRCSTRLRSEWVKNLYSFAALPDITFFFRVDPAVAIGRILEGRPELKYHEAGMDLNLSPDPYESFRIFQGRIHAAYESMIEPFGFTVIDSNRPADVVQQEVRNIVRQKVDLPLYKLRSKVNL